MSGLSDLEDAYGHAMDDYHRGAAGRKGAYEIVERDDGYLAPSGGPALYFAPFHQWPAEQREAVRHVRGRVLDVGCGAGRVALHLQGRGHEVVGIDISPLAVKVARSRGVRDARVLPFTEVSSSLGRFDTIVMFGNNFGLFGNPRRARWLLRRLAAMTSPGARILAETLDPYRTKERAHLEYHESNRRRGRMPGQVRIRVRYGRYATPFFDYLFVSPREMKEILRGTGWSVLRFLDRGEPVYEAVVEKNRLAVT